MRVVLLRLSLVAGIGILVAACGQTPPAASSAPSASKPAAPAAVTGSASSPAPRASAVAVGGRLQLGNLIYNDHGRQPATGQAALAVEAGDYYFSPTFVNGSPGQKLKLMVQNKGRAPHNFSISGEQIDENVAPGTTIDVDVSFPASGAFRFFCKFHAGQGMNGQLLAADATPQPVREQTGGGY